MSRWFRRKVESAEFNVALGAVYVPDRGTNRDPFDLATGAVVWLELAMDETRHARVREAYRRSSANCFDEIARRTQREETG